MNRISAKTTLRFLWRTKKFTFLNLACLSFGLASAIIAFTYIMHVVSFDRFHKNYDRLYTTEAYVTYFNGDRFPKQYLTASLPDMLKTESPEIEEVVRTTDSQFTFVAGEKSFTENGLYADESFFDVFSFSLKGQEGKQALSGMNSIVISSGMARKFFGNPDCKGKTLTMKDGNIQKPFTVAGVFGDVPEESTLQFDYVIPFKSFLSENPQAMETGATACLTWVLLRPDAKRAMVEKKIKNILINRESTLNQELFLFPLGEKALYGYADGRKVWKDMQYVFIAGSIGLLILLIACFNFINLAVTLNMKRYVEAGVRKAAGSGKAGIAIQFLGETLIIILLSLCAALILSKLLFSAINMLMHFKLQMHVFSIPMLLFSAAVTLFATFTAGFLPASYLASSNPVDALKGRKATGNNYSVFRQSLIVFQFLIPVILIITVMIIKAQDRYMRNYDVGVDKDKLIIINNTENLSKHLQSMKTDLLSVPGIEAVSFTNCVPSRGTRVTNEVSWAGKDATQKLHFWYISSDHDYDKTVKLNITEGRFFNTTFSSDTSAYMINDVAAKVIGNSHPVGSEITVEGRKGTIIGVFSDFHAIDLAGPLVPSIISVKPSGMPYTLVKFSAGDYRQLMKEIMAIFRRYDQEGRFNAALFRDLELYSNLAMPYRIGSAAFVIALLLACLGLYGLASFTAENRTKEIGIRKANGATSFEIMTLLLMNFMKWLFFSIVLALPVSLLVAKMFLGRYYFHTPLPVWAFIAGPLLTVTIALVTVMTQTLFAANRNPALTLRYE